MSLDLSISDLADWNDDAGWVYLRLAICDSRHNGSLDHLGADGGLFSTVTSISITSSVSVARNYNNLDWLALRRPVTVVQVIEVSGLALVEGGRATQTQFAVGARGEAARVDGIDLRRIIKLELIVGRNVPSTILGILQNSIVECQ